MAEFDAVAPNGPVHVARLAHALEDPAAALPAAVISLCRMLLSQIAVLGNEIASLEKELLARARQDDTARRLMTIPGIGVICATAMEALAPPPETFEKGRDFAALLSLTPRQDSSGGKTRLSPTTKMGQRDLRRLLICGAVALVRWAVRKGATSGSWLAGTLERKPRMVVAVAMANRMARVVVALMSKGGVYKVPDAANARCVECFWKRRDVAVRRKGKVKRSIDGIGETGVKRSASSAKRRSGTQSAYVHNGPRRVNGRIMRPNTRQHLTTCPNSINLLASEGASTQV
jgi:hypothetical protein